MIKKTYKQLVLLYVLITARGRAGYLGDKAEPHSNLPAPILSPSPCLIGVTRGARDPRVPREIPFPPLSSHPHRIPAHPAQHKTFGRCNQGLISIAARPRLMGGGPASSLLLALGAFANLGLFGWQQWSRPPAPDPCQAAERCVAAVERLQQLPAPQCADTPCTAAERCEEAVHRYDVALRATVGLGLGTILALLAGCCLCRRPRVRSAPREVAPTAKRAARPSERVAPVELVEISDDEEQLSLYVPRRR